MKVFGSLVSLLLFLPVFSPSLTWGAKCASSASGPWSSPSTWSCGSVPTFGSYSAVINSGHTVTIDDSRTIPPTVIGTTVSGGTAILVMGHPTDDITVTAAGPLVLMTTYSKNSNLTLNAGTTLAMGPNSLIMGGAGITTTARWDFVMDGTAQRRVLLSGSGVLASPGGTVSRGAINWRYATVDGFDGGSNILLAYHGVTLANCLFTGVGVWSFGGVASPIAPASPLDMSNTDFRTGKGITFFLAAGYPTGLRSVRSSTFVSAATSVTRPVLTFQGLSAYGGYLTFTDSLFYHYRVVELNTGKNSYERCAFYTGPSDDGGSSQLMSLHGGGTVVRTSLIYVSNVNSHGFLGGQATTTLGVDLYDNLVVENHSNWDTANLFIPARHAGTTMTNVLTIGTGMMPITSGLTGSCTVASAAVNSYRNNTFTWSGGGYYWENGTPGTPQNGTNSYKNNLHYAVAASRTAMMEGTSAGPRVGGHLDEADNNGFFRTAGITTPFIANLALANWQEESRGTLAYLSPTSFSISGGDFTGGYTADIPLSVRLGDKRAWVKTAATTPSSYSGGITTVYLNPRYAALTAELTQLYYVASEKAYGTQWGNHDVVADPSFSAPDRNLTAYTGTTPVAFFDELARMNGFDVTGTPASRSNSWSVPDAMAWIREGFTPTNPLFATAGEGGGYLGGVAPTVIRGMVLDSVTGAPITDTMITIGTQTLRSDSVGGYLAIVTGGDFAVTAGKSGYEKVSAVVTASLGQTTIQNFTLKPLMISVQVICSGVGSGSVSSSSIGISCGSICFADYIWNTPLILTASPSEYSLFAGWSGAGCGGPSDCTFAVLAPITITANFTIDTAHSVRADGPPSVFYSTIYEAFGAMSDGVLRVWGMDFGGDCLLDKPGSIIFLGGQNSGYTAQIGMTAIRGILTISKGSLTVDRVIIR